MIDEIADRLHKHVETLRERPIPENVRTDERHLMLGTLTSAVCLVRGFKYGLPPDVSFENRTAVRVASGLSQEALARAMYEAVWNDGREIKSALWAGPQSASGPKWVAIAGEVIRALNGQD